MSGLRGFGVTIYLPTGEFRQWYVGSDGVERWADNDQPTKPQGLAQGTANDRQSEGATHEG